MKLRGQCSPASKSRNDKYTVKDDGEDDETMQIDCTLAQEACNISNTAGPISSDEINVYA